MPWASKQGNGVCGRDGWIKRARAGGAEHFVRAEGGWVKVLLTWKEGRLARAEEQHLVEIHHAEIFPLVLCCEKLHYQLIARVVFARLKASG